MLTILHHLHSLVANNLQLHWGGAAGRAVLRKYYRAEALRGRMGTSAAPARLRAGVPHAMPCSTALPTSTRVRVGLCALAALALSAQGIFAAESAKTGASEVIFLVQLVALMLVGRLLGELMNRIGQPSVMGMLLGGIVLGPSMLGVVWPDLQHAIFPSAAEQKAMLDGVAQFGILLLLLLTGMETDLKLVRTVGKAALSISLTGVAVPFICGFALGQLMPEWLLPHPDQRLLTSLFLGTALSISSIKIVAAVVREMGFTQRKLGLIIVASAICEDSIGWVIIAITLGLAQAGTIDFMSGQERLGDRRVFDRELHLWTAHRLFPDSVDERQFRERLSRDHDDSGDHGRDGAHHACHRRAHGAGSLRRGGADRGIADSQQAHR